MNKILLTNHIHRKLLIKKCISKFFFMVSSYTLNDSDSMICSEYIIIVTKKYDKHNEW